MKKLIVNRSSLIVHSLGFVGFLVITSLLLTTNYLLPTTYAVTQEEQAVYNMSRGNLPEEVVKEVPPEEDKIRNFLNSAKDFVTSFFNPPEQREKYYSQSERINQGYVPLQVIPKSDDFFSNLQNFVGNNTGFYSVNLPPQLQSDKKISDYERSFESSYFPEGIAPVTGQ